MHTQSQMKGNAFFHRVQQRRSVLRPWECHECNEKTSRGEKKSVEGLVGMRYEMRQWSIAGTLRLSHLSQMDIQQLFLLEQIRSVSTAYRSFHIEHSNKQVDKDDYRCSITRLTHPTASVSINRLVFCQCSAEQGTETLPLHLPSITLETMTILVTDSCRRDETLNQK